MKYNKRRIGTTYEKIAGAYLETKGYQILEYNFRCRRGEIDIIARDGECLVFCEVKYRVDTATGYAAEAVDRRKQKRISDCALFYLMIHEISDTPCRFDVVCIENEEITLYQHAFEYQGDY
jgi:putative endonuclease